MSSPLKDFVSDFEDDMSYNTGPLIAQLSALDIFGKLACPGYVFVVWCRCE